MFYAWRNSGCREYQRLRLFGASGGVTGIHRPRIRSDRMERKSTVRLAIRVERIPLLWELGIGHFCRALMSATITATTHADLFPTDLQLK